MTHIVLHNYLPRRWTRDYITESNGKFTVHSEAGKPMGTYGNRAEAKKRLGQIEYFKHHDSRATEQVNRFGSLDYQANMHHFKAEAEWPDGTKTHLFLMAPTMENAKKQYKAQVNAGGWPKITGIKQAQVKPEPR